MGAEIMTKNDHLKEGFRLFAEQQFAQAEKEFVQALELDPEFDLALNALTEVYNRSGNVDKAMKTARKLVSVSPEDPLAHAALSRIYMQKGMIEEAEKELAISNKLSG
jgi:Tfp pilus assembly protein PilF